jgi:hypothetical protein
MSPHISTQSDKINERYCAIGGVHIRYFGAEISSQREKNEKTMRENNKLLVVFSKAMRLGVLCGSICLFHKENRMRRQ